MTAQKHISWFLTSYLYGIPDKNDEAPFLEEEDEALPEKKHEVRRKKKYGAIPGVFLCQHLYPCRTRTYFYRYWVAIRPNKNSKPRKKSLSKSFSVSRYGFHEAKEKAEAKRREFETEIL